jgi:hypothetical protein
MLVHERAKLGALYRVGFKDNLKAQISMQAYEAYQNHASCCKIFAYIDQQPNYSAQPPGVRDVVASTGSTFVWTFSLPTISL